MTATVHRIRSMDAQEYAYLIDRNSLLEDINAHQREVNTALEGENRHLREVAADLEHGLGEQARLLALETTAREALERRLAELEAQALNHEHQLANIVSYLKHRHEKE